MIDRIKKIIETERITPSLFADIIGISRSSMNHILNGRNNPSLEVLKKILEKYQNLNSDWLLFGKLPMYKQDKSIIKTTLFEEEEKKATENLITPPISREPKEYPKENELKSTIITQQPAITQLPVMNLTAQKKVSKIMIFYTDNTFETFIPDSKAEI